MYDLVQTFGTEHVPGPWERFALPALVEDEDGQRILLTGALIDGTVFDQALVQGAKAIFRITEQSNEYVSVPVFFELRTRNSFAPNAWDLDRRYWDTLRYGEPLSRLLDYGAQRDDDSQINPLVHLHTHSEFSALDGYSTVDEIGQAVLADGGHAVALTDHGECAGHPALDEMARRFGLQPIYGMEANFVDDRHVKEDTGDYRHLVVFAQDDEGLRNLWALSTEGYRDGFYQRPRIDWNSLERHGKGLIVSTGCLRGPLADPYLRNDPERAMNNLARLGDLFGDRLCVELHANRLPDQMRVNEWLLDVCGQYHLPMIAAVDSHYAKPEQARNHQRWLAMQTGRDVNDEISLFTGNQEYHLMTLAEVRHSLSYLPQAVVDQAIENTSKLAETCTAEIRRKVVKPVYSRATAEHPDPLAHDVERFLDMCEQNWEDRITRRVGEGPAQEPYFDAYVYQTKLLIEKAFCGYYLICADFVNWAKERGILVGPGRGSGGASINAYLMRITEIDPIEADLLFDRFMTKGRKSLPDFDIDFPSMRGDEVIEYVQERWGREHVARVGSHIRLQNRGAFKDTQRAISSELPGESFGWVSTISKLIEAAEASTAGLGLSWEELMAQIGEMLDPFRERMPVLFEVAQEFHHRLRTYGKHAAGLIIDPDSNLEAELPMRRGDTDDSPMVTQFDMDALEYLGKVKFDFLRLRNLDTIQATIDLIKAETGQVVNPYVWTEEYNDPQVFEALADGWTLGVFQIETPLGKRTTRQLKPTNRADLTNIITIGRPGPLRSGLDKVYMRRRDGIEQVTYTDPRMEQVLNNTFGVMLYQEDIMGLCITLAGYESDEADDVRKILGKKKVDQVAAAGQKFIQRAVANGTDRGVAEDLWVQMAEFAKYSFNRAHAHAYSTIACWTAWLKTHYPRQSMTAAMVTIKKERIPEFVNETRRLGYKVLPPDINLSGRGFTAHGLEIRYGFESVPGIGAGTATSIVAGQKYETYDDFIERTVAPRGAPVNMGHVKKLVAIGTFDSLHPHRRALEAHIIDVTSGVADKCENWAPEVSNKYNNLPCVFDWDSEEPKRGRTGKILKTQPKPPARCTRACRRYVKRQPTDYSGLPMMTDQEIRDVEVETLGVFLSSSPFDVIPQQVLDDCYTADELVVADNGEYLVLAVVISTRPDSKGRDFGFASLLTPSGEMSVIIFSNEWDRFRGVMTKGRMMFAAVLKTADDRYRLTKIEVF